MGISPKSKRWTVKKTMKKLRIHVLLLLGILLVAAFAIFVISVEASKVIYKHWPLGM